MGNKIVCLDCRKTFNQGTDFKDRRNSVCPECGKDMLLLPHRFRPPSENDGKKWEVVKYLINSGFHYQHVYKEAASKRDSSVSSENYAHYSEKMIDAREFVEKYRDQKLKFNKAEDHGN